MPARRRALLVTAGLMTVVGALALFRPWTPPEPPPQSEPALRFAKALAAGRYDLAHGMLSSSLQAEQSAQALGARHHQMIDYGGGPPDELKVLETLDAWATRQPGDIGWAYVSVGGDGWAEGITVVLADQAGKPVIRSIEWGRP